SPTSISAAELRDRFRAQLARAATDADLKVLHDEFLSRKSGAVTALMKTLGAVARDARHRTDERARCAASRGAPRGRPAAQHAQDGNRSGARREASGACIAAPGGRR